MKNRKPDELIQEGNTLYILHEIGWSKGEPVYGNKYWMGVYADFPRGLTNDDAIAFGEKVKDAYNNYSTLQEENKKMKEGIEYAISYLQKGGFGRVDCLNKLLSTLTKESNEEQETNTSTGQRKAYCDA